MRSDDPLTVITLEQVSKRYYLRSQRPQELKTAVLHLPAFLRSDHSRRPFWALDDVSLTQITGRENAILNAVLLGLSRREAAERLPEIIAFSELGDFIDQPMRTYSSGMYIRLGFAVAVHVKAHVLLVDEVLAVGDPGIQQHTAGPLTT